MPDKRSLLAISIIGIVIALGAIVLPFAQSFSFPIYVPDEKKETPLHVDPFPPVRVAPGQSQTINLSGSGLDRSLQGWIVPELSSRRAVFAAIPTYSMLREVKVRDSHAYLLTSRADLLVVDLSNPKAPTIVNVVNTSERALHFDVEGDLAAIATGAKGLTIASASPDRPGEVLATIPEANPAIDVVLKDRLAYVARADKGLSVYDLSNPRSPREISTSLLSDRVLGLASWDHYLIASLWEKAHGIAILDISVPSRPRQIAQLDLHSFPITALTVQGGYALVTSNDKNSEKPGVLHVIDLTVPSLPKVTATLPLAGRASDISWHGDDAIVSLGANGIQLIDLTKIDAPRPVGNYSLNHTIISATADGETAWLATSTGDLIGFDLRLGYDTSKEMAIPDANPEIPPIVKDGLLISAEKTRQIKIYRRESAETPRYLSSIRMPGEIKSHLLHQEILLVSCMLNSPGNDDGELLIVDLRLPEEPRIASRLSYPHEPLPIAIHNKTLTLVEQRTKNSQEARSTLHLLDLSDPDQPKPVSSTDLTTFPVGSTQRGNLLYLLQTNGELVTFDLTDSHRPAPIGSMEMSWLQSAHWRYNNAILIAHDDLLLVSAPLAGIKLVDIHDPTSPTLLGTIETDGLPTSLAWEGDTLYVARREKGILTISMNDPLHPKVIGLWPVTGVSNFISVERGALWRTHNGRGIFASSLPQPLSVKGTRDGRAATVKVSDNPGQGSYALWLNNEEGWAELPGQINIGMAQ